MKWKKLKKSKRQPREREPACDGDDDGPKKWQSLAIKLVVIYGYNFTQYLFIGGEFW